MPSEHHLRLLITRALGVAEAERTLAYQITDLDVLQTTAQQLMGMTPSNAGACLLLSAAWALHLRDRYNIPAVAVAGDLKVAGRWMFRTTDPLPEVRKPGPAIEMSWKGHCWVEVGGYICDASIFRTIYKLPADDLARQFIEGLFGTDRGAFLIKEADLPAGLKYRRSAVLNKSQMIGFFESLRYVIEGARPN
jgi:hypothetical protein